MVTANDIPTEKLVELANRHIARFGGFVEAAKAGRPGYRLGECEGYLVLWIDVKTKLLGPGVEALSVGQLAEIQDAIECGDYDALLGLEG